MADTAFLTEITLEQLEDDPYPTYARLRREAPVAWIPAAGVWFATRFEECAEIGTGKHGFAGATSHPTLQRVFGAPNVLTSGGEEHADLRRGVDPPLQPGPVHQMIDALVRPVAKHYLAELAGRTEAELMSAYFEPVSVEALRQVMGLEGLVDAATLRRWFADLNLGVSNFGLDPESFAVADRASAEIESVVRPHLEHLRRHPDHSMLSHMIWTGREDGEPRSLELILPSLKVILLGGMQEPGHAAGSTLHGLFSRPDQLALTYADPEAYIPLAVHEGLRWIAPIGAVERQASADVTIAGVQIPAGDIVMTILGSANRDETRFDDPDVFDLDRSSRTHQAFGNGEHFCAGHFFARQVQRIMFEELLAALPGLRADPRQPERVTGWVFRAPKSLPVQWDPPGERPVVSLRTPVVEAGHSDTRLMQVRALRLEAEDVVSVELVDPDGAELPPWEPGAHLDLWVVADHAGHYSLCSDPADRTSWRIAVLREPDSRGVSTFVHEQLRPGMHVQVGGPRNTFPLAAAAEHRFVAGGIGITPLLPMMRQLHRQGTPFRLDYCGRRRTGMAFLEELATYGDRVHVHVGDEGSRADLEQLATQALGAGATMHACGPERMVSALEQHAESTGLPLVVERFAAGEAHREDDGPFQVTLSRTGLTLDVPADRTILDVLEEKGLPIPNVCREGNCGTCETRVLGGAVDHRDVLLTPRQRRANERMMICVSRAASSEPLVLDL
ncbi:cytochrome P450/oxidoreductase [Angustibacter luteus]|uniref:Cytochrome P450 n=1 Tax=Angustibacter luteus TaxID=658456 RepID=A0ABW1JF98_9ACTN